MAAPCVVSSAQGSDFPIENLPYGVLEAPGLAPRVVVAIGNCALDCHALARDGLLDADGTAALANSGPSLDAFLALDQACWAATRAQITALLTPGSPLDAEHGGVDKYLLPTPPPDAMHPISGHTGADTTSAQGRVAMRLPFTVGDYTDFYSSLDHARNVGTMFRGADHALSPNWLALPVAYHGRASSVVASGTAHPRRPRAQLPPAAASEGPRFGPSAQMDYELELGCVIGGEANALGHPVSLASAESRIFGCVLVNDWSARDVQRWEYVPLGPFTSKNLLTTVSPWVVPYAALSAARCAPLTDRPAGTALLPYLAHSDSEAARSALDIDLEVAISRPEWQGEFVSCRGNARTLFWSFAQQIAHHTVTGCNLRPGDLLATGTISGPAKESRGCLLERTWRGEEPLTMPDGSQRTFLDDGDTVTLRGVARGPAGSRIGFGACVGTVVPVL